MKNLPNHLIHFFSIIFVLMIAFQSCKKEEVTPPIVYERGDIIESNDIGTYSTNDIQQLLDAGGAGNLFPLQYQVKALSVNYSTVDSKGKQIVVSGALFIPTGVDNLRLLSMQHGTETKRNLVASVSPNNSTEGIIGLLTASMGYLTLVPDYPGFGTSELAHPYMHAKSLVPCVIDFIRAGKSYTAANGITLNGQIFLTGYSEGGYLTLLTQKVIEEEYANEFKLTAVAPMSGPYDLKGMSDSIFHTVLYSTPAYVAFILDSYNRIYGWKRLEDFFIAPYASIVPGLFDGSKTWGEIVEQLPLTMSEMMNSDFIADYKNGNEAELVAAFRENTLLDWTPKAPLHFLHGDADSVVPYQNVLTTIERFTANGAANIQLTTIAGGTHETSGSYAVVGAIQWFEDF